MQNLSFPASAQKTIYTVSQLNRETKLLLSEHFLTIQVEGEISNLTAPTSGHLYFSLKDPQAQVRCAMFRTYRRKLPFTPENGNQVVVTAQVGLYEARGDYQLIVEDMQEAGDGALRRAFEALKTKLSAEGLFDQETKQQIPTLPQQVGVITSPSGAAIRDILTIIKRRFPALPVVIYPATVQGETAKYDIVRAIETANRRQECDVLILARGGGSLEDLWPFNEEIVARAIYASKLPIISAVGHEIDFTIADFAADLRAPTPSAAAERAVPDHREWLRLFQQLDNRLVQRLQTLLVQHRKALDWLVKRFELQHPGKQLQYKFQRLDELESRLHFQIKYKLQQSRSRLENRITQLGRQNPADKINHFKLQQHYLHSRLVGGIKRLLEQRNQRLASNSQTLHAVSPAATLRRGYAIVSTLDGSKIIRSTEELTQGDRVRTRLAHGEMVSHVEAIESGKVDL